MTIVIRHAISHMKASGIRLAGITEWGPRLAATVTDTIFPTHCILCGEAMGEAAARLCDPCDAVVARERKVPACPKCARSVAPFEVSGGRCKACRGRRPPVDGVVRVATYCDAFSALLRSYKYHGRQSLEPALGGWLAEAVGGAPWRDRVEAVVPVPTFWRRRITSPLHAAEALAAVVAKGLGLPNASLLRRVKGGPHQIGLTYRERLQNVRGAFELRRGAALRGARLLIIDDVKTTGATINECAGVLRRAGAAEVYAAVLVTVSWDPVRGTKVPPL